MSAFDLNKSQLGTKTKLVDDLRGALTQLQEAVDAYNEAAEKLWEPVTTALTNYNNSLAAAREFVEGIVSDADEAISEKSDKWQEGEKGQAAIEFKDTWENLSLDDIEIEEPADIDFDDPTHADDLEEAPDSLD